MAGSPQIPQGSLNRLRASVLIPAFTFLNVTPSFLTKEGISFAREGNTTTAHEVMVGTVQSPEPYQKASVRIHLLKTNGLAQLYEQQLLSNSLIGNFNVITDTSALGPYAFFNGSIETVRELSFAGTDPGYVVTLAGFYAINASLWT
jgi:hypothetical protein